MKKQEDNLIWKILEYVNIAILIMLVLLVIGAVFLRYVFNFTLPWSDELARYLFIYLVMMGVPTAMRKGLHIRIEFFVVRLPPKLANSIALIMGFLNICLFLLVIVAATKLILLVGKDPTPALHMPTGYVYLSLIPLSLFMIWLYFIRITRAIDRR
jgi:TRAP-type C4-dicarboxylate transport system permease small subunit